MGAGSFESEEKEITVFADYRISAKP